MCSAEIAMLFYLPIFAETEINISTIVAGIIIGFGVVISKWLETRATNKREDQESVFRQQRAMIDDSVKRIKSLENNLTAAKDEIRDLRSKNESCFEEHRKSQEEISCLQGQVKELRDQLQKSTDYRHRF